jgi:hypothetical protein
MVEPSSVSGTLKSTRMKTRLLAKSMSRMDSLGMDMTPGETLQFSARKGALRS